MTREDTPTETDGDDEATARTDSDAEPHGESSQDAAMDDSLPADVADEAERLTRLARDAIDDNEAAAYRDRREALLEDHEFTARIRGEGPEETLVLHPTAWVVDGSVHPDRIDDIDRAVERPLEGAGETEDWDELDAHNSAVAERVAEAHGAVHGANARAFATFMSNHYARPVEEATRRMREEFLTDYFPRNAWPDDDQRTAVAESLELVAAAAEESE
jgi:hypothetical protein